MMSNKLNFTKAALNALPIPSTGRVEYSDLKVPGLVIRVTANGVKTFSVFRRVRGGKPTRQTIGKFPDVSIEQARQRALTVVSQLAQGVDVSEQRLAAARVLRFSELFVRYMAEHSRIKKITWKEDEAQYRLYLSGPLGTLRLNQITRSHVAAIHSQITAAGHSATADRVHALVSSIFGWSNDKGIWNENPARGIKKNKPKQRDRFLQRDELPNFFKALEAEPNEQLRDFFLIALFTGARRAQVQEMRWSQISLSEALWKIRDSKNGDPQNLPLSRAAIDVLNRMHEARIVQEVDFVFPSHGKTGHIVEPKSAWIRIKKRMAGLGLIELIRYPLEWRPEEVEAQMEGLLRSRNLDSVLDALKIQASEARVVLPEPLIPNVRIHDLRRTLGSWMAITGASLPVIGKGLNHRSSAATEIYARLDQDPVRAAMDTAASAIQSQLMPSALPVQ